MLSGLTFAQYQKAAMTTAVYPVIGGPEIYPALELANEAGEVAGKIKKIYRDKGGEYAPSDRDSIVGELGDCLWALSQIATELGLSLDRIARLNLDKLQSRQARNVLGGSGDNR